MTSIRSATCVVCLLVAGAAVAQTPKTLTNDGVIQMVKAGFSEATVIKAIESNEPNFDTSVEALLALKQAGVGEQIIEAMLAATQPQALDDPNDPQTDHPPGIYWLAKGSQQMVKLERAVVEGQRSSGTLKSTFTFGLAKHKSYEIIANAKASVRITEPVPEFRFYFGDASSGATGTLFSTAPKPEEFILAKMQVKDDQREVEVARVGLGGSAAGISEDDTVSFDAQQIALGVYKVVPREPLSPGEYCFVRERAYFEFGIDDAR